jgi:tetratricopeptide (TPR) repeat protein
MFKGSAVIQRVLIRPTPFAFPLLAALLLASPGPAQTVLPQNDSASSQPIRTATPREMAITRGDIQMARKDYDQAIVQYQVALQSNPKDAQVLNKVGIAYEQLGQLDKAERAYRKALGADKKFSSAANNWGTLEYQRSRYGKAIKHYKQALARDANQAVVYSNLGYAYYGNKQYPEAMASFGKALALDPDVFARKGGVGSVLQSRTAPDPALFNFLLARFYARSGDAERAAHYLKLSRDYGYKEFRSAEKDPEFASVINDPRVQEVLKVPPSYDDQPQKPLSN